MYNKKDMGFFSSSAEAVEYSGLIDIGSGSVLVSIIASEPNKSHPTIIWTKREHSTLRKIESLNDSIKQIISTLLTAALTLEGEGKKALRELAGTTKLKHIQVTVSAPWAYTSTKSISYSTEEEFEVTEDLVNELLRTASQKTEEEIQAEEKLHQYDLTVVVKSTLQVLANGYPIVVNDRQSANSLVVVESSGVIQDRLLVAIDETLTKVFPNLKYTIYPFMLPFYSVMRDTIRPATEFCLVEVTKEATELGVVRDGILSHVSYIPFGSFSIAREIAEVLSVPLEEAYGYLACDDMKCFLGTASKAQQEEIDTILMAYQKKLAELFLETGDALAIPKRIYLHNNLETEAFFEEHLTRAAALATKMQHAVYLVTKEQIKRSFTTEEADQIRKSKIDTAALISAQFFHTNRHRERFTHL